MFCLCFFCQFCKNYQEFTNLLALRPGQDLDQILAELETPGSKKKAKKGKN